MRSIRVTRSQTDSRRYILSALANEAVSTHSLYLQQRSLLNQSNDTHCVNEKNDSALKGNAVRFESFRRCSFFQSNGRLDVNGRDFIESCIQRMHIQPQ